MVRATMVPAIVGRLGPANTRVRACVGALDPVVSHVEGTLRVGASGCSSSSPLATLESGADGDFRHPSSTTT